MKTRPCPNCPWRVGVVGARDIPGWGPALAAKLAHDCRDDGLNVMACHKSVTGREIPCAGFVVQVGYGSIGVRLLHRMGQLNPDTYEAGPDPLHPGFEAMLAASGVPVPPRNRALPED